ncbi:nitroreductase family protein [Natroniella acetigena]|uniref:nitroreductase family protein n=1 Tax=Natroniella acetigena TaxID=52004 RepID=UPI00200AEFC0|nr:nitroreductase family protein [Natroniella acetigena]MCK8827378.1 nitroreductase family protein [Natroniella acetigena]
MCQEEFNFVELLKNRRSIRKFKDLKVEEEKIDQLIKSALLAPTSRNNRPWEFIIVQQQETLTKLSEAKEHGSAFLKGAPLAVVVLADPAASDVWIEDASIASVILQLTAERLDLGSCWVQIRKRRHKSHQNSEQYVRELLHIPDQKRVESIIGIGYPAESKPPYTEEELDYNKVFTEKYKI